MANEAAAVLTDGRFFKEAREVWGARAERFPEDLEEGRQALNEILTRPGAVVLHGSDGLAGAVVSAYWSEPKLGAKALKLWPLKVGQSLVGEVGGSVDPVAARKVLRAGGVRWEEGKVSTMKVTSSREPAARYGFSFGVGWVHRAFEARQRRHETAGELVTTWTRLATDTWRQDDGAPWAERFTVDGVPGEGSQGSLIATTLPRTFFGLGGGEAGPKLFRGVPTASLIRQALTPGALDRIAPTAAGFSCVHLDAPAGWVVDGELHDGEASEVLQVRTGPAVTFVKPELGIRGRLTRLLIRGGR